MGKHSRPKTDCVSCQGSGKVNVSHNGTPASADCSVCEGTGKV